MQFTARKLIDFICTYARGLQEVHAQMEFKDVYFGTKFFEIHADFSVHIFHELFQDPLFPNTIILRE